MKRIFAFLMAVLMLGTLFGCKRKQSPSDELWVVTEATTWDHMNGQVAAVAAQFEKEHEEITVRIDILPTEEPERSVYIQQLRTQILRGGGPDVYLLPTSTELMVDAPRGYTRLSVDPFFPDVMQAMGNGMFRDIAGLYDNDRELGKESLKTSVMNAGVMDGKRYVLPLRYDIPVIYGDMVFLEPFGLTKEALSQNADLLLDQVLALENPWLSGSFQALSTAVFTQWMDYDGQQVSLDADTIAAFMKSYRDHKALAGETLLYRQKVNVRYFCIMAEQNRPRLHVGSLSELVDYAPIYQYEDRELVVLPLHGIGGDVVAEVTYYGAVGSGCRNAELAYSFLRQFLLEDSQWEKNRPQSLNAVGYKGRKVSTTNGTQVPGLIEAGWPVRTQGSLNPLWVVRKRQFYNSKTADKRTRAVAMSELESTWEQILAAEPDQVRFGSSADRQFQVLLQSLNDPETNAPKNVDINALAEDFWWQLRWHVAEG